MCDNAIRVAGLFAAGVLLVPAQAIPYTPTDALAHIRYVEGEARLQRASEPEPELGELNVPVFPGDRLWTHMGSRAEVRLADGTLLRLSESTKVDFVALGDENVLRLWSGSVILRAVTEPPSTRIDAPAGSLFAREEGTYRVDVDGEALGVAVYRGSAELSTTEGSEIVVAGYASRVDLGEPPEPPYAFNTARLDDFDRFSDRRDSESAPGRGVLVRSLPHAVQPDAPVLERHGTWTSHPDYGPVWYPTVSLGWAPYRYGRWCYTRYGYAWVSSEPWGWAPYHYGRWGHGQRGWYWIPGATWGPAWVSFAFGTNWIGWSPLGFHDRPVYVFNRVVYDAHRRARPRGLRPTPHGGEPAQDGGWNFVERHRFQDPPRGERRLSAAEVGAAGPARVLPSAAVLDRDLTPRATGTREVPGNAERRRASSRFDGPTRRLVRPAGKGIDPPPATPATRTSPRTSPQRSGSSAFPSRNVPSYATSRASDRGSSDSSSVRRSTGERRGARWTTPDSGSRSVVTPPRTTAPPPRVSPPLERPGARATPRRAAPARAAPRATPRRDATSSRSSWTRAPSPSPAPSTSAPTRSVTPRSQPTRSTPGVNRTPPGRTEPATRGAESRGAERSRGSGNRKN